MTEPIFGHRYSLRTALKMRSIWLLSMVLTSVGAQVPALTPEPATAPTSTHTGSVNTIANAKTQPVQALATSKAWQQLTPGQKQALAPLGAQWGALTAQQQNKWLALSQNFAHLSVTDQITAHTRMADWVALSPQQRNLARLNFNKLQNLPKQDKKAKWEAYQALSAEEKRLLSAGSATPPKSAAPTAKPLEPHRQVQTTPRPAAGIPAQPTAIDRKTLLPHAPVTVAPASAPSTSTSTPPQPENFDKVRSTSETSPS